MPSELLKGTLGGVASRLQLLWFSATDPRRIAEVGGERVVYRALEARGLLAGLEGRRILEVGPKHGQDSLLLARLKPRELVLIDLPEKESFVSQWLPEVSALCPTTYLEGNLLYLTSRQYEELGKFDLIFCLGVLYHNVEQLRLLKRLFDLCDVNGRVVVESSTTRNRKLEKLNAVEVCWPETYRGVPTITHLPSRFAIKSWLEMVGFKGVEIMDVYSRRAAWQRAVLTGTRAVDSVGYVSYAASGLNPAYVPGESQ